MILRILRIPGAGVGVLREGGIGGGLGGGLTGSCRVGPVGGGGSCRGHL